MLALAKICTKEKCFLLAMRPSCLPYLSRCGLLMCVRTDQFGKIKEVRVGESKNQEFTIQE